MALKATFSLQSAKKMGGKFCRNKTKKKTSLFASTQYTAWWGRISWQASHGGCLASRHELLLEWDVPHHIPYISLASVFLVWSWFSSSVLCCCCLAWSFWVYWTMTCKEGKTSEKRCVIQMTDTHLILRRTASSERMWATQAASSSH